MRNCAKHLACTAVLLCVVKADPVAVRHRQGYIHGFLVLKDMNDTILASGDLIQLPSGNRITDSLSLRFADGSLYEEKSVFSQSRTYRLLTYKQAMKGASFKTQETLWLDASSGAVISNTRTRTASRRPSPKNSPSRLTLRTVSSSYF
jgi:hypothetical protein